VRWKPTETSTDFLFGLFFDPEDDDGSSSETLIGFHRITRRYISEDRILQLFVQSAVFRSSIKPSPLLCFPISLFFLNIFTWQGCSFCSCAPFRTRNVRFLYLCGSFIGNVCGASKIITVLPYALSKDEISASFGSQKVTPNMLISLMQGLWYRGLSAFRPVSAT
jgi:hypothetical protein